MSALFSVYRVSSPIVFSTTRIVAIASSEIDSWFSTPAAKLPPNASRTECLLVPVLPNLLANSQQGVLAIMQGVACFVRKEIHVPSDSKMRSKLTRCLRFGLLGVCADGRCSRQGQRGCRGQRGRRGRRRQHCGRGRGRRRGWAAEGGRCHLRSGLKQHFSLPHSDKY